MVQYRGISKELIVTSVDAAAHYLRSLDIGPESEDIIDYIDGAADGQGGMLGIISDAQTNEEMVAAMRKTDLCAIFARFHDVIAYQAMITDEAGVEKLYQHLASWGVFDTPPYPGNRPLTEDMMAHQKECDAFIVYDVDSRLRLDKTEDQSACMEFSYAAHGLKPETIRTLHDNMDQAYIDGGDILAKAVLMEESSWTLCRLKSVGTEALGCTLRGGLHGPYSPFIRFAMPLHGLPPEGSHYRKEPDPEEIAAQGSLDAPDPDAQAHEENVQQSYREAAEEELYNKRYARDAQIYDIMRMTEAILEPYLDADQVLYCQLGHHPAEPETLAIIFNGTRTLGQAVANGFPLRYVLDNKGQKIVKPGAGPAGPQPPTL